MKIGKNTCPTCKDLDPAEHCVRRYLVTKLANLEVLKGAALTMAPAGDCLGPKVFYLLNFYL
jgi:hypothetical protein